MQNKKVGTVVQHGYHGTFVRVITSWANMQLKEIEHYPDNADGNFAVTVDGTWYACMPRGDDRILFGLDKDNKFEFDDQVFRLCDNAGTCMVPDVVREAEAVGHVARDKAGNMSVFHFQPDLTREILTIYPKEPKSHFVLSFEDSDHVFIENGNTHFVVKVHTIPDTFEYNKKTYTVSRHGSSTMVSDGSKTFICVLENGECYVQLVKDWQ